VKKEIFSLMEEVYDLTAFSDGPFVKEFENKFASFCDLPFATGVNNGTSALHLALLVLNIGPGDEVIVPANTFIATAWAVTYTGATPVFADCTTDTWQIDPESVKGLITPKTRAVIGVHLYGQPCEIDSLKRICKEKGLYFIEDAAQAHGALYKGRSVGGFGELGCFSFYPGKNLGACGEAGAVVTSTKDYDSHLKRLRNHGSTQRYFHDEVGFNMRMSGFEAASLIVKLKYLEGWNRGIGRERRSQKGTSSRSAILWSLSSTSHQLAIRCIIFSWLRFPTDCTFFPICRKTVLHLDYITPGPVICRKHMQIWDTNQDHVPTPNTWRPIAYRFPCMPNWTKTR
jgi:dTDP-4-amino-4,6-dideoxygalactose transaminase